MVDCIIKDVSDIDLTSVIFEVSLVGSNPKEWWIDTGPTHHVCSDHKMFFTFEPRLGKRCTWETLPPFWKGADFNKCIICT